MTGAALPGVSSGQALQEMERIARETLPQGYDFAWAGLSLEETKSGSQAAYLFALSIVLVYLVLAAQYESWVLPFIILLGVPLAVFGALSAQLIRGFSNDVFCQVGLVMLIGLAAKNSILIVEFAEQLRGQGRSIVDAAVEAARIRLRPILMTSFAFILGVLPLAYATGAGAGARNSVGTAVAGGMLASTFLSIIFIPVLYVIIRTIAPGKVRHARCDQVRRVRQVRRGAAHVLGLSILACRRRRCSARVTGCIAQTHRSSDGVRHARTGGRARAQEQSDGRAGGAGHPARRGAAAAGARGDDAERQREHSTARRQQHRAPVRRRRHQPANAGDVVGAVWRCRCSRRRDGRRRRRRAIRSRSRTCRPPTCAPNIAVATAQAYLAIIAQKRQVEVSTARARNVAGAPRLRAPASRGGRRHAAQRAARRPGSRHRRGAARERAARRSARAGSARRADCRERSGRCGIASRCSTFRRSIDEAGWMALRPDVRLFAAQERAADRVWRDSFEGLVPHRHRVVRSAGARAREHLQLGAQLAVRREFLTADLRRRPAARAEARFARPTSTRRGWR